jgi:hypothetical protein
MVEYAPSGMSDLLNDFTLAGGLSELCYASSIQPTYVSLGSDQKMVFGCGAPIFKYNKCVVLVARWVYKGIVV